MRRGRPAWVVIGGVLSALYGSPSSRAAPPPGETADTQTEAKPPVEVDGEEEAVVDFAAEETASDRQTQRIISGAGGDPGHGTGGGFKLFVDLLAEHRLGEEKFEFRPNHFYVLVQAPVADDLSFMMHVSDNPVFYEITWNITPRLAVKAGKILVPFGTNEFHHLFGGRVDEESAFLPETWGDFGLGVSHLVYDGDLLSVEYQAYAVNGFEGMDEPYIIMGDPFDNNMAKGLGARLKVGLWGTVVGTGSAYYDIWDEKSDHQLLFYAAGLELRPGWVDVPVLRKLRLRGEWGRGEIGLPGPNRQQGILTFAKARAAFYAEATYPVLDTLHARLRVGRINPDNTVTDDRDATVLEPAVLYYMGKLAFTLAYQFVAQVGGDYDPEHPADVLYAKFFLQY